MAYLTRKGDTIGGGTILQRSDNDLQAQPPCSMSCWVNWHKMNTVFRGIMFYRNANSGWGFLSRNPGAADSVFFYGRNATGWEHVDYDSITLDTWYHLVGTINSSGVLEFFIDGTSVGTDSTVSTIYYETNTFQIGRYDDGVVHAKVADCAMWSAELVQADIDQLYDDSEYPGRLGTPRLVQPDSLIAYWPLCRWGPGQDCVDNDWVPDVSGNGRILQADHQLDNRSPTAILIGQGVESPRPFMRRIVAVTHAAPPITVAMDALTLASSAPDITVDLPGFFISMDALTLASSTPSLTVVPTTVIAMNALTLASSPQDLAVAVSTTKTYQQGVDNYAGCEDTWMQEDAPTGNYGGSVVIAVRLLEPTNDGNALILFDLDGIPAGATITSARLTLKEQDYLGLPGDVGVHRCKRTWAEMQATWNIYSTGNSWESGGGTGANDHDTTAEDTQTFSTTMVFDIKSLVQEWLDETYPNQGVLLKISLLDEWALAWHSSEAVTSSNRPKLVVGYLYDGPITITMNALTLASSVPVLTVVPGVVNIAVDALTLTASAQQLTVVGATIITLDALTLASSAEDLTVATGVVSMSMDALTLASSTPNLTVSAVTVLAMDALTLAGSIPTLTVAPGTATISMDALTLTAGAQQLIVETGTVITLDALTLVSAAENLTVTTGAVSMSMDALSVVSSVPSIQVVPGAITITADALTLASAAQDLTVSSVVSLAMDALTLSGSAESLTIVPGAISVAADALSLASAAQNLTVVPGAVSISVDALTLASSVPVIAVTTEGVILLQALTLTGSAQSLTVVPGAATIPMSAVTLVGSAESLQVLTQTLIVMGVLTVASSVPNIVVVPGEYLLAADALTLASSTPQLTVVTGAVTRTMNALTLASSAENLTVAAVTTILLDALTASVQAQTLTVSPGVVTIAIDALTLQAVVRAITIAGGVLILPDGRGIIVAAEDRLIIVTVEDRIVIVPEEDRMIQVNVA